MQETKKSANVIGNGASKKFFVPNGWFTVTCNLEFGFGYDAVSMIDPQPVVWLDTHRPKINRPIWCRENVKSLAVVKQLPYQFEVVYRHRHRMNSGHHAVGRLIELGYTDIHLWGFDSIWTDSLESLMDQHIPRSYRKATLKTEWHQHWIDFHQNHPHVAMTVHTPHHQGTLTNDQTRFKWHRHLDIHHRPDRIQA